MNVNYHFMENHASNYLKEFDNLYLFYVDGYEGLPQYAPFDRILITAADPFITPRLEMHFKHGGKFVHLFKIRSLIHGTIF